MTSIGASNPYSIDLSKIKKLQLPEGSLRKLTEEESAKFQKMREAMYSKPTNLDELKNHISQKTYAEVKVGGKTVATIYNNGASMTSNAMGGKITDIIEKLDSKLSGPDGAQERADAIAKALGGTVVKAPTAVTQAQYMAVPEFKLKYEVDYEAMERDIRAATSRVATPQTQVDAQLLAENGDDAGTNAKGTKDEPLIKAGALLLTEGSDIGETSAKDEFLKFQDMSWEEKVRALILKSMGLEEEDLEKMSAEERGKIEAKIKEKIDEEIEKKTGMKASPTAWVAAGGLTS